MIQFIERMLGNRVAGLVKSLGGFLAAIATIAAFVIFVASPFESDLVVTYSTQPVFLRSVVDKSGGHAVKERDRRDLTLLTVVVANKSKQVIEGLEVHIVGVVDVLESSARTSSAKLAEDLDTLGSLTRTGADTFAFHNLSSIPPGHNVQFQAVIKKINAIIPPALVRVTSAAQTQSVTKTAAVAGLAAILAGYSDAIWALLIAITLGIGLRKLVRGN